MQDDLDIFAQKKWVSRSWLHSNATDSMRAFILTFTRARAVLLVTFIFGNSVYAQRFINLTGEIRIMSTSWKDSDSPPAAGTKPLRTNEWPISFLCVVGTNEWQLEGDFSRNATQKWFYDGTNIFTSTLITKSPPQELATNKGLAFLFPPLEKVRSNLTVNVRQTEGGYPLGDVGINIPWLAFCSGGYLKRTNRIVPLPTAIIGNTPDAFGYSDKIEAFKDELGLPRKVELFTSEALYEASVKEFWKQAPKVDKSQLTSGLQDGLRKFHYTATESTNFLGWNVPLRFEFALDIPKKFGGSARICWGFGKVSGISEASGPIGVFDTTLYQTVVDSRFNSDKKEVNAIVYHWSNSFLAPTSDPALQVNFTQRLKRAPSIPAIRVRRMRLVLWILISLAGIIPALILFMNTRKPKTTKSA